MKVIREDYYDNYYDNRSGITSPPRIGTNNTVIIPRYPRSGVAIETSTFIACNYLGRRGREAASWWFFVEVNGQVGQLGWNDLTCEQQLAVRIALKDRYPALVCESGQLSYTDSRCELIEALT